MDKFREMLSLIREYLKYYFFVFLAFGIFRTLLFEFDKSLELYYSVFDVLMYWIICVSLIMRFHEIDNADVDSTLERAKATFFKMFLYWISCSLLFFTLEHVVQLIIGDTRLPVWGEQLVKLAMNSSIGVMTVLGTFFILDLKTSFFETFTKLFEFVVKTPIGIFILLLLHISVTWVGQFFFKRADLAQFIEGNMILDAGSYFAGYLTTFISLVVYGSFYWVFKPEAVVEN